MIVLLFFCSFPLRIAITIDIGMLFIENMWFRLTFHICWFHSEILIHDVWLNCGPKNWSMINHSLYARLHIRYPIAREQKYLPYNMQDTFARALGLKARDDRVSCSCIQNHPTLDYMCNVTYFKTFSRWTNKTPTTC